MTSGAHLDSDSRATPAAMFTDVQMRRLKLAVIGMGLILILGFALVIGRVVYLLNRTDAPTASAPSKSLADSSLMLPAGAVVRHVALSGNRLAVHYDAPAGAAIAIVDIASGSVVHRLKLETGEQ